MFYKQHMNINQIQFNFNQFILRQILNAQACNIPTNEIKH
jgi:hypothetical protein